MTSTDCPAAKKICPKKNKLIIPFRLIIL